MRELVGTWYGSASRGPGADWSSVTLTLREDAGRLVGTAKNHLGQEWQVSSFAGTWGILFDVAVEGDSCCCYSYNLEAYVFTREPSGTIGAMQGSANGRCYGTVAGTFFFRRI